MKLYEQPSDLLATFAKRLQAKLACAERELTVTDLRVALRAERLTEISEWSFAELDEIEHAANSFCEDAPSFCEDAPLTELLSKQVANAGRSKQRGTSLFDSPSPLAWV